MCGSLNCDSMKANRILVLATAVFVAAWCQGDELSDLFPESNEVVAEGAGVKITRVDLDGAVKFSLMNSAAEDIPVIADQKTLEEELLHELVFSRLMAARATRSDRSLAYTRAKGTYNDQLASYTSAKTFDLRVAAMGISTNSYRKRLYDEALTKAVMERELTSKIRITDGQCRKFYEDNKANWTQPEQVRVQHVLLGTMNPATGLELSEADKARKRQLAEQVRNLALQRKKFTDLVLTYSEDPGTRRTGGEYTFDRGVMAPEFERVSFAMQANQISRVVETQFGYHVIRMVQRIPKKVKPYSELQKDIQKYLAEQEGSARLPAYYKKLRDGAGVKMTLGN